MKLLRALLAAALVLAPVAARAACTALPYTFVNGTLADADQVNANFNTVWTCANASVTGPAGSTTGDIVVFADTTGKVLSDSGQQISAIKSLTTLGNIGALRANLTVPSNSVIYVLGYYAAGDGGEGMFVNVAGSAASDNGGTIIVDGGSNRWFRDFAGKPTPQMYGASGSSLTTTGTISASSSALALAGSLDFQNGHGIRVDHAGAAFTASQPSGLAVTQVGTAGATTIAYQIASLDAAGGVGQAITAVTSTSSNASRDEQDFDRLTWSGGAGASSYAVWANVASAGYAYVGLSQAQQASAAAVQAGGTGYLTGDTVTFGNNVWATVTASAGVITGFTLTQPGDSPSPPSNPVSVFGGSGTGATANLTWKYYFNYWTNAQTTPGWIPSTPPGSALADWLVTTVGSGGGTTSLTLAAAATTAVTSGNVYHDDTARFLAAIAGGQSLSLGNQTAGATYRVTGALQSSTQGLMYFGAGPTLSTVKAAGVYDVFSGTAADGGGSNFTIDATEMAGGAAINTNGGAHPLWNNVYILNPYNPIEITGASDSQFKRMRITNARGAYNLWLYGPTSTNTSNFVIEDSTFGHVNNGMTMWLWDGNVQSGHVRNIVTGGKAGACFIIQNLVNGSNQPQFFEAVDFACNNSQGPVTFLAGGTYKMNHLYNQGDAQTGFSGVYIAGGVGPVTLEDPSIFGWGFHGVDNYGFGLTINSPNIYANSSGNPGVYDGVKNEWSSTSTTISGGFIGAQGSSPSSPYQTQRQACGIEFAPGSTYGSATNVNLANNIASFCNNSGGWPGNICVNGDTGVDGYRCNLASGTTLSFQPEIEPASTNLYTHAFDISNGAWTITSNTTTTTGKEDPLGGTNGVLMQENSTATQLWGVNQAPTLSDNTMYMISTYAKASGDTSIQLSSTDKNSATGANICTLTGSGRSVLSGNGLSGQVQARQDGWYRCGLAFFSLSGVGTARGFIRLNDNSQTSTSTYTGVVNNGAIFWGSQFEALASQANTTLSGNLAAGNPAISVTSATGFAVGRRALVVGAGSAGAYLDCPVAGVSGTTITLACPALTGVSSGAVVAVYKPQTPTSPIPTGASSASQPTGTLRCTMLGNAGGWTCGNSGISVP